MPDSRNPILISLLNSTADYYRYTGLPALVMNKTLIFVIANTPLFLSHGLQADDQSEQPKPNILWVTIEDTSPHSRTMTMTYEWYQENVLDQLSSSEIIGEKGFKMPQFYHDNEENQFAILR